MKNTFSELLSEIISQSEISKNEMIRACDIDRSSFFKFLNGSRIPTMEQLNKICSKLQFTPLEEKKLRMEYARITSGEEKVLAHDKITKLLWMIEENEADEIPYERFQRLPDTEKTETLVSGKAKVLELLTDSVLREAALCEGKYEVFAFLPPSADEMLDRIRSFIIGKTGKRARINHLIELPSRNIDHDRLITDRFRLALLCTLINPDVYSGYYYYSNSSVSAGAGVFYPYSVITEHRVILMNERMNRAIVLTDPECCADYVDQFLTALNSARPIMRRVGIRELPAELTSPVIYRYGSRKLKDKPFKDNPVIYVSPAGVRNLMKPAEDQAAQGEKNPGRDEHTRMLKEMRERVGTSFFFIDERNIPSAKDWFIAVSGSEKLIFYKMDSSYCFIMSEPEMVRAFYNFMEELPNSGNLLRNDLALEIIDSMIAGTGN